MSVVLRERVYRRDADTAARAAELAVDRLRAEYPRIGDEHVTATWQSTKGWVVVVTLT